MKTRTLGRTGLEISEIALGTEYLVEASRETVVSVVREAVRRGVNYFDVLFAFPRYQENFGVAFEGLRDEIMVAGHLGSAEQDGQYRRTRDVHESEQLFHDLLRHLKTDRVDVLFLSNCDEADDYRQVMGPGGLLGLAQRLQREGKARFLGLSGHAVPVAVQAVRSGAIGVLMHTVSLSNDAAPGRRELCRICAAEGVGLIAMKSFAGGALLRSPTGPTATAVQCLSYALSQPGVCSVVPGVKDVDELNAALDYVEADDELRDFSEVLGSLRGARQGQCVYCNHCLPCPVRIDVARTMRLLDSAAGGVSEPLRDQYAAMPARASDCVECGDCTPRCPFKVDVIASMRRAVEVFEQEVG